MLRLAWGWPQKAVLRAGRRCKVQADKAMGCACRRGVPHAEAVQRHSWPAVRSVSQKSAGALGKLRLQWRWTDPAACGCHLWVLTTLT